MATESSQPQSIQARIAALNLGQVGKAPITATPIQDESVQRPPPAPRSQTANLPATLSNGHYISNAIGNEPNAENQNRVLPPPTITRTGEKKPPPPALPPRKHSTQPSPALPPRRPTEAPQRRGSNASISSAVSTMSTISIGTNASARTSASRTPSMDAGRKLAPAFDHNTLPPLPPKRTPDQVEKRYRDIERSRRGLKPTKSNPNVTTVEVASPPSLPSRPPRRAPQPPTRKDSTGAVGKLPPENPPPMPARSALSYGMNKPRESDPGNGVNEVSAPANGAPPPIPASSKPDLASILATKPKPSSSPQPPSQPACLTCRDFSAPDNHAAKFPKETVPSIDWLASQLVAPFTSPTDQARAIFTWLHHNIAYDIISFCNKTYQRSTPAKTLATGLAVCEGYAGLFTAIASKAGLESVVVSGHGKGAGFSPLAPGEPIPAEYSTHAWNAVKIDNGEWKLIDTCWGAGYVCIRERTYTQKFSPRYFTMGNNEFGLRHFPTNKSLFHRTDGRSQISWEEYILGPNGTSAALPVTIYSGVAEEEGISETKLRPSKLRIPTSPNMIIQFRFENICEHWDPRRHGAGAPYPYVLRVQNPHARNGKEFLVFDTDGKKWWLDVESRLLGQKGQSVDLYIVTVVDGRSARGMGVEEMRMAIGRKGMSFGGVAKWELD
ncbi:MAG: hypothetical protein LQ348_006299 [Seirophora lacunosa]|nr:MAG: hypothetical protein LQ348_006299 [Seirophora lacunosa]